MTEHVQAWQCIGCGKIEAPQTCIGVCRDVKVELVYASQHEETLVQLKRVRAQAEAFEAIVRQLARTTPREGQWERSYRALQAQANRALGALARDGRKANGMALTES